jgi:hypothetical protein
MIGVETPETCWATYKRQVGNFVKLIHLVGWFIWIVWWCTDLPTSNNLRSFLGHSLRFTPLQTHHFLPKLHQNPCCCVTSALCIYVPFYWRLMSQLCQCHWLESKCQLIENWWIRQDLEGLDGVLIEVKSQNLSRIADKVYRQSG